MLPLFGLLTEPFATEWQLSPHISGGYQVWGWCCHHAERTQLVFQSPLSATSQEQHPEAEICTVIRCWTDRQPKTRPVDTLSHDKVHSYSCLWLTLHTAHNQSFEQGQKIQICIILSAPEQWYLSAQRFSSPNFHVKHRVTTELL